MIYCIGNSHVNTFSNSKPLCFSFHNKHFVGHSIGPIIAYNFRKNHLSKVLNYLKSTSIQKKNDFVTLVVGEVDCRLHLPRQADLQKRKDKDMAEECTQRLMECYDELRDKGFRVLVCGTHPTTTYTEKDIDNVVVGPIYGDVERRNQICLYWNESLKTMSEERNIPFISIYKYLVDANNITKMEFYQDYCHLKSDRVFEFILRELESL